MRNVVLPGLVLASVVILSACPLESSVPLGEPRAGSFDPRLLGQWRQTQSDGAVTRFEILPFNDAECYVELREDDKTRERYRAYMVAVGGVRFLNVNQVKSGQPLGPFVFARYSISATGDLSLRFIGEHALPKSLIGDRKGMVRFVAAHLESADLYDQGPPIELHRVAPSASP